jgi:hypothetical protein
MKKILTLLIVFLAMASSPAEARKKQTIQKTERQEWCELLYKMAAPILSNMAEGRLQQEMTTEKGTLELSPTWDGRDKKVSYMEAFGRLMDGLAPWLSLPDDDTEEGVLRRQLREWALKSYANAVDPESSDYLGWQSGGQTLVDAAFLVQSFHRGWDALWEPLDSLTKARYIAEIQGLRRYDPCYNNWLLFCAMEECFLMKAGAQYDNYRIHNAMNKVEEWYVGDGWYSDGPAFAFDYYNSYVIQPMYLDCLEIINEKKGNDTWTTRSVDPSTYRTLGSRARYDEALKRMQKYSIILERLISPEGTYPVFGRSIPYRMAVFQPLAMLAWQRKLPEELSNGQVRSALTAVMRNMFADESNFNEGDFLTIGFVGTLPNVADSYTNNGSLYITTFSFLPLGLPADDPFWTDPAEKWTSKKAWEGEAFPKDHKWKINKQILYWE